MSFIYKIINDINGKVYIGKTDLSIEDRFSQHCRDAFKNCNEKRPLYAAIRKYGVEHFHISQLEKTENPDEREIYWIAQYNSKSVGYNATQGGDGKRLYDYDLILNELILCNDVGFVAEKVGCSVDTVRHVADQHKIKTRIPLAENFGDANERRKRSVHGWDSERSVWFDSLADAARWLYDEGMTCSRGKSVRTHISDCANGKATLAYGMKWRFVDRE